VAFSTQDQIPYTHTRQLQQAHGGQDLLVHAGQRHVPGITDPYYMSPQLYRDVPVSHGGGRSHAVYQGVQAVGKGGMYGVMLGRGGGGGERGGRVSERQAGGLVYQRQPHIHGAQAYAQGAQFC